VGHGDGAERQIECVDWRILYGGWQIVYGEGQGRVWLCFTHGERVLQCVRRGLSRNFLSSLTAGVCDPREKSSFQSHAMRTTGAIASVPHRTTDRTSSASPMGVTHTEDVWMWTSMLLIPQDSAGEGSTPRKLEVEYID
jgi:hypothetical protein